MKILVTGSTGFIGRHVLKKLSMTRHQIIATGLEEEGHSGATSSGNITYVPCDLADTSTDFSNLFGHPDSVIHLAWQGLPNYGELFHFEKNLPESYAFLKGLVEGGTHDVNVIGTCLEYGMQEGQLSETFATQPCTPYAVAKDTLRKFLEQLQRKTPFFLKWIRLFYMYGEGQSKRSILEQLKSALKDNKPFFEMSKGDQLRDYLSVGEVADRIVRISLQSEIQGIINCCSGTPISIRDLVESYLESIHANIALKRGVYDYPNYEPKAFWGDTRKLQTILDDSRTKAP